MINREELIKLGERVKQVRLEKKISQTQLAYQGGKDQPSINRLEKGKINPSYLYLLEICQGLEITLSKLLKEL
jgi:transcriptional regulator with XRE-family HTH domain